MQHVRRRPKLIGGRAPEDLFRTVQRRSALPLLHHKRIAGLRHRPCTPVPVHQQVVLVHPAHALLAVRQGQPTRHKLACLQVELAVRARVLATRRKRHHAELVARVQAALPMQHPAGLLRLAQRVQVDHRLPVRLRGQIICHAGLAIQAPCMVLVAPQVVHLIPA